MRRRRPRLRRHWRAPVRETRRPRRQARIQHQPTASWTHRRHLPMRVAPLLRLTASHVRTARSSMHQAARTVTCVDYRCDTPSNAPNDLCESFSWTPSTYHVIRIYAGLFYACWFAGDVAVAAAAAAVAAARRRVRCFFDARAFRRAFRAYSASLQRSMCHGTHVSHNLCMPSHSRWTYVACAAKEDSIPSACTCA